MFRSDSQDALDQWLSGKMTEKDFKKVYYDNWNFNWRLYNMIFDSGTITTQDADYIILDLH